MKVILLDAMNLIHRARSGWVKGPHALTFNFFRNLKPILERFDADLAYFVLEGKPVHRIELLPEYKGTRKKQPDSFWSQKDEILSILSMLPIIQTRHPKHECDDVIANLAKKHLEKGHDVTIVSNDTDFIQLFDVFQHSCFHIWNPRKKAFVERPDYNYLDWKSLRGDSSDNIPGIKGVGDKTAEKLLANPQVLSEFLLRSNNQEIFQRNKRLIGFQWFSNLNSLETATPEVCMESVKKAFNDRGFESMVKETYWKKFEQSFNTLMGI